MYLGEIINPELTDKLREMGKRGDSKQKDENNVDN